MTLTDDLPDPFLLLCSFVDVVKDDPRISTVHISFYTALLYWWREKEFEYPLAVFSHEIMPLAKISGSATYHRTVRELSEYGYIRYTPSYNHFLGSLVHFVLIQKIE